MPETELVNIVINGQHLQVPKGEMIIESARRIGVDIPHFCYHPRLSREAGANCRMCLVEVSTPRRAPDGTVTIAKMPKPQTSCSLPADEGMVIETETPDIVEARRGILEFLLINHPLDCPVCDRGGECPLQNNTLHYGPATTRYVEEKRHLEKTYPLSRYVVLDRERCIHCARCTRFAADIAGDGQLGFLKRGADMKIAPFDGTEFTSLFSGNVIELCPVGALLSRTYRFNARPWDLATTPSICTECSNGCNVKLDHRAGRLVRVNARLNEAVNEEWTCDRGKFGMDYVSSPDRLRRPLVRHGDRFHETSWDEALSLVADKLKAAGPSAAFLGGCRSSNEDLYAIQRLFREVLGSAHLDHRLGPAFPRRSDLYPLVGHDGALASISGLERMRTVVLFGCDLAVEQPIVFLRVRKAALHGGTRVIEVQPSDCTSTSHPNRVRDFAVASASYGSADAVAAAWGLLHAFVAADPSLRARLEPTISDRMDTVRSTDLGIELSGDARGPIAVLVGQGVVRRSDLLTTLEPLGALVAAMGPESTLAIPATEVNEQGARDLGILPDTLPGCIPTPNPGLDTAGILDAAAKGEAGAVWLSDLDIVTRYHDPDKARQCLESSPFVVVTGIKLDATASMADVVLPVCSVAERDGTFTNVERRVQRIRQAYEPAVDAREEWRIAATLAARLGTPFAYASWRDVLRDIAANVPMFTECTPEAIGDGGLPLHVRTPDERLTP